MTNTPDTNRPSKNDLTLLESIANWFDNHPNVDLEAGGIELLRQYRDGLRAIVSRGAHETAAHPTAASLREAANGCNAGDMVSFSPNALRAMADRIDGVSPLKASCEHEWIDARNEVVVSGEWCRKCGAVRAGNAPNGEAPRE